MAIKNMTPVKGSLNKFSAFSFEAATTASDGLKFAMPGRSDEYVVVLVQNTDTAAAHNITVKQPEDGSYYASGSDETHQLASGEFAVFRFESAKWANRDGTIHLVPDNVAVKAVVLY